MNAFSATILTLLLWCSQATARELVTYSSIDANGNAVEISGVLNVPNVPASEGRKFPAVILLHTVGGWSYPVTEQYAKALTDAGYVTLEPRLFPNKESAPTVGAKLLPMVYDGLGYLATRGDVDGRRIGIAGFSFGGAITLHAAAEWAQLAYARGGLKFAAHAPFYPSCGLFTAFAQGKRKTPGIPADALTKWTGAPIKIFAGGRDDYDNRDPNACGELVAQIPKAYQPIFSVQLYPEATHGWDQQSATFYDRNACNGRGCTNSNEANPTVTRQGISDLIEFFGKALAGAQ